MLNRPYCDTHEKVLFNSKKDAVAALVGQLKSKRVRVYDCSEHPGKVHMTKEGAKYKSDLQRHRR